MARNGLTDVIYFFSGIALNRLWVLHDSKVNDIGRMYEKVDVNKSFKISGNSTTLDERFNTIF